MPEWRVSEVKVQFFEDTEQWSIGLAFKYQLPEEQYRHAAFLWFPKDATPGQIAQAFMQSIHDLQKLSEIVPPTSA